jgi:hypothetical protein
MHKRQQRIIHDMHEAKEVRPLETCPHPLCAVSRRRLKAASEAFDAATQHDTSVRQKPDV